MRILVCTTGLSSDGYSGGVESIAKRQHEILRFFNQDSRLMGCWFGPGEQPSEEHYVLFRAPRRSRYLRSAVWGQKMLRTILKEVRKSDLVHIHACEDTVTSLTALLAFIFRKPFVLQSHGMLIRGGHFRGIFQSFYASILSHACGAITLSKDEENALKRYKIIVPFSRLGNPAPHPHQNLSKKIGQIAFVGRLNYVKAPDRFLEIIYSLRKQDVAVKAKIMGVDHGMRNQLIEMVDGLGLNDDVTMVQPGSDVDAQQLIAESQILIVPSRSDVFPAVILEAAVNKTAVVISDNVQIAKELNNYRAAIIESSIDAMTKAVNKLLSTPSEVEELTKNAQQWVDKYTYKNFGENLIDFYSLSIAKTKIWN